MALKFFWRCEGTSLDATHDFSGGDTSATANNSPAISAAGARIGTNGLVFDGTSERYQFDSSTNVISPALGSLGFWLRSPVLASGQVMVNIRGTTGGNSYTVLLNSFATQIEFEANSAGGGPTSIATSGTDMVVDTWYFIVCRWNDSADLLRAEIYDNSLALIASGTNSAGYVVPTELAATDGFRIGDGSGSGGTFHVDNFFIADAYAEPLESNATITSYTGYSGGGASGAPRFQGFQMMMRNN